MQNPLLLMAFQSFFKAQTELLNFGQHGQLEEGAILSKNATS